MPSSATALSCAENAPFCRGQRVYGVLHEARSAIPILRPKGIAVTELVIRGRVRDQVAGESG
jgi:hypothetical protein